MKQSMLKSIALVISIAIFQAVGAPDFSLIGFAAGVTGGAGGRTVQVNNASAFKTNCQSSEKLIIQLTGKIDNATTDIEGGKNIWIDHCEIYNAVGDLNTAGSIPGWERSYALRATYSKT